MYICLPSDAACDGGEGDWCADALFAVGEGKFNGDTASLGGVDDFGEETDFLVGESAPLGGVDNFGGETDFLVGESASRELFESDISPTTSAKILSNIESNWLIFMCKEKNVFD